MTDDSSAARGPTFQTDARRVSMTGLEPRFAGLDRRRTPPRSCPGNSSATRPQGTPACTGWRPYTWGPAALNVRPVLAVWLDGALYTTSADEALARAGNLAADPRCTVTARTETKVDVVLEGTATRVAKEATLQQVAEAYRSKYGWPVTVTDGAFDAPYGAPTAGPPPYYPYEITPATVFRLPGTADEYAWHARPVTDRSDPTKVSSSSPERSGVPAPLIRQHPAAARNRAMVLLSTKRVMAEIRGRSSRGQHDHPVRGGTPAPGPPADSNSRTCGPAILPG